MSNKIPQFLSSISSNCDSPAGVVTVFADFSISDTLPGWGGDCFRRFFNFRYFSLEFRWLFSGILQFQILSTQISLTAFANFSITDTDLQLGWWLFSQIFQLQILSPQILVTVFRNSSITDTLHSNSIDCPGQFWHLSLPSPGVRTQLALLTFKLVGAVPGSQLFREANNSGKPDYSTTFTYAW